MWHMADVIDCVSSNWAQGDVTVSFKNLGFNSEKLSEFITFVMTAASLSPCCRSYVLVKKFLT